MTAPFSPRRSSNGGFSSGRESAPNSPRRNSQVLGDGSPTIVQRDSSSRVISYSVTRRSASFDLKSELLQREYLERKEEKEVNASQPGSEHIEEEIKGICDLHSLRIDVGAANSNVRRPSKLLSIIEYDEDKNETRIVSPLAHQFGNQNAAFSHDLKSERSRASPLPHYRKEKHRAVMYKRFAPYLRNSDTEYGTTYSTFLLVNPYTWNSIDSPMNQYEEEAQRQLKSSRITTYKTYVITTDEQTGENFVNTFMQQYQGE